MKKILGVLTVLFFTSPAYARESNKMWGLGKFVLGLGSGFVGHESGHYLAAAALHDLDKTHWQWTYIQLEPRVSDRDAGIIAVGGFSAEIISSEIILSVPAIKKDSLYILGWLAWDILNPIFYVIRHEMMGAKDDLALIEESSSETNKRITEAVILTHAAVSALRLFLNPEFGIVLNPTKGRATLNVIKTF